jgi:hypothetical protein
MSENKTKKKIVSFAVLFDIKKKEKEENESFSLSFFI